MYAVHDGGTSTTLISSLGADVSTLIFPTRCRNTHSAYCLALATASSEPEIVTVWFSSASPSKGTISNFALLTRINFLFVAPFVPIKNLASACEMTSVAVDWSLGAGASAAPRSPSSIAASTSASASSGSGER